MNAFAHRPPPTTYHPPAITHHPPPTTHSSPRITMQAAVTPDTSILASIWPNHLLSAARFPFYSFSHRIAVSASAGIGLDLNPCHCHSAEPFAQFLKALRGAGSSNVLCDAYSFARSLLSGPHVNPIVHVAGCPTEGGQLRVYEGTAGLQRDVPSCGTQTSPVSGPKRGHTRGRIAVCASKWAYHRVCTTADC